MKTLLAALLLTATAAPASAAIIAGSATTFIDTVSGREWLRLDYFSNVTIGNMQTQVAALGYTFAGQSDISAITAQMPMSSGTFAGHRAIIGSNTSNLIWGIAKGAAPGTYREVFAWSSTPSGWNDITSSLTSTYSDPRLAIFAYREGTAVPEPAMLGLFGLGAIGLGLSRRRR